MIIEEIKLINYFLLKKRILGKQYEFYSKPAIESWKNIE